jgi:peptidyl-prolyl cis-trans isomerase C
MMRKFASLLLLALPALAQQNDSKTVAVVNGETITAKTLDQMYDRIGPQMRAQYDKAGGKTAFLDNYVNKRLIVQEALKSGFDKHADVQLDIVTARESAIFDDYVRDVVSSDLVKDVDVRQYYDQHKADFATPERIHVRHIVVREMSNGPRAKSKDEAKQILEKISAQIDPKAPLQMRVNQFAQFARQYSEDAASRSGGDLGLIEKGQLDPDFEAAAWKLPVGKVSNVVQTQYGYHLILVEAREAAGTQPFDDVKSPIRDVLLNQKMAEVMSTLTRLTNELRASSKIAIYKENIR